jgi:hypothetical protein
MERATRRGIASRWRRLRSSEGSARQRRIASFQFIACIVGLKHGIDNGPARSALVSGA